MKTKIKKYFEKRLAFWAARVVTRSKPDVIAITGSIAKTSTKEAIFEVLFSKFGDRVGKTPGNMNNEMGLPLALLGFTLPPPNWKWPLVFWQAAWRSRFHKCSEIMVVEMGVDKPGDIPYLVKILRPKIAVVTVIGATHLLRLKTVENVAKEKAELIKALPKDGIAILNGNCKYAVAMAEYSPNKPVFFFPGIDQIAQEAARAVGRIYGIKEEVINDALNRTSVPGRLELLEGREGSWILNDCYNASPLSVEVALAILNKTALEKKAKRKIAVLGDMLELGDMAEEAHQEIITIARGVADVIVGVGPEMKKVKTDQWFGNNKEANQWLLKEIKEGDIILIKGSHGIHLEKVVAALRSK